MNKVYYEHKKAADHCLCGHTRRVHVVEGRDKMGTPLKSGKCLGGSASQPMSCDCPQYQKQ